jgi:hypothetical protein
MKRIGKSLDSREQVETGCFVFNNSKLFWWLVSSGVGKSHDSTYDTHVSVFAHGSMELLLNGGRR